jgi:arginyl-tRNA synthetase
MADPILALRSPFRAAIVSAFGGEHEHIDPALRRSDRADYQANVALALCKIVGGRPRDVAATIVKHLNVANMVARIEIAGPGFINLTLDTSFLSESLSHLATDSQLGIVPAIVGETVVIDYSSPNVAKEMHVGNLRSTIIGDALSRVLEDVGHRVIRQNHLGDWGTPFGMLIEHLLDIGVAETSAEGPTTGHADPSIADLGAFYREARAKFDSDPAFADRARRRVVLLQSGDRPTLARWHSLVVASKRYFAAIYDILSVKLTDEDIAGESLYNPMLPEIVAELEQKGLTSVSDGALCVFPPGFPGRDGAPLPLIVRKQDGGFGYATTDLAAVRYRVKTLGARRLVYVVGATQSQHLAMVFKTAELAGWLAPPSRAEHVAFGSVLGADRKMFKTRGGETVRLIDLLDEADERALAIVTEKNPSLDDGSRAAVARAVGVGAIKYADLSSDRIKDYVFDWSRMLAFDGNTAPYLQYAHARISSIIRRGEVGSAAVGPIALGAPAERALGLEILGFGTVVHEVAATLQPHRLCTYLYGLSTAFSTFYETCPVLNASHDAERRSRMALSLLTARVLAHGLDLLGIAVPERM